MKLVDIPLVYTGDTFLIVADKQEKVQRGDERVFKTVFMFHTTDRSWLALAVIAGLLAGVFAASGSLLS